MTRRAKASSHILNTGVEEDRISHYYQHLAKARTTTIKAIEQTQTELEESQRLRKAETKSKSHPYSNSKRPSATSSLKLKLSVRKRLVALRKAFLVIKTTLQNCNVMRLV